MQLIQALNQISSLKHKEKTRTKNYNNFINIKRRNETVATYNLNLNLRKNLSFLKNVLISGGKMATLNWKLIVEFSYVLVVIISVVAIFFSLNPLLGVAWAAVLTAIAAFFEVFLGYILFEKILG